MDDLRQPGKLPQQQPVNRTCKENERKKRNIARSFDSISIILFFVLRDVSDRLFSLTQQMQMVGGKSMLLRPTPFSFQFDRSATDLVTLYTLTSLRFFSFSFT